MIDTKDFRNVSKIIKGKPISDISGGSGWLDIKFSDDTVLEVYSEGQGSLTFVIRDK